MVTNDCLISSLATITLLEISCCKVNDDDDDDDDDLRVVPDQNT